MSEGKKKKKITNLADKCWNVHGVGGEAHPVSHGGLHAQEIGHELIQLLMDAQVSYGNHTERAHGASCFLRFVSQPQR